MTQTELAAEPKYRKGAPMEFVTEFVLVVLGGHKFFEGDDLRSASRGSSWSISEINLRIAQRRLCYAISEDV